MRHGLVEVDAAARASWRDIRPDCGCAGPLVEGPLRCNCADERLVAVRAIQARPDQGYNENEEPTDRYQKVRCPVLMEHVCASRYLCQDGRQDGKHHTDDEEREVPELTAEEILAHCRVHSPAMLSPFTSPRAETVLGGHGRAAAASTRATCAGSDREGNPASCSHHFAPGHLRTLPARTRATSVDPLDP